MISHDNLYWTAMVAREDHKLEVGEVLVSYLPLSHIAAQLADMWVSLVSHFTVVFADKMALKGTLLSTLKEARPTRFFGVPRVWEKIMEGMLEKGRATKGIKRKLAKACKKAGIEHHFNNKDTIMYKVGQRFIYNRVREALGLDRCHGMYSAAAPNAPETVKYFLSLDIVIHEWYGMTEATGPIAIQSGDKIVHGSVGQAYPGCQIKLSNKDEDGKGEICMKGRSMMMGYLNSNAKTNEAVDTDGWLHTGDMGTIDADGHLYITGRYIRWLIILLYI